MAVIMPLNETSIVIFLVVLVFGTIIGAMVVVGRQDQQRVVDDSARQAAEALVSRENDAMDKAALDASKRKVSSSKE